MTPRRAYSVGSRWRAVSLCSVAFLLKASGVWAQTGFDEIAIELGIDVRPTTALSFDFGSGAAFIDIDGDGYLDLYVAMGHGEPNRFYRYDPETDSYTDIAAALGCADAGNGKGIKFADYDNDGDRDLFITNSDGSNKLYRNEGGLAFRDVTVASGLDFEAKTHGAAWGDYDNDGHLDLWISVRNRNVPDKLYRNRGNGTFGDVSVSAGIVAETPPNFDCVWIDYDRDGDQDAFVATDGEQFANRLFRNNGNGKFTDVAVAAGVAGWIGGMGIAVGDYDNDGWEDMYVTHTGFAGRGHILLHSNRDGTFTDVAVAQGVAAGQWGWGTDFLDYDNDGDLDLYVVHWGDYPDRPGTTNQMYRNDLTGRFALITAVAGVGDQGKGFGLATGDYNNDGYLDMFVVNRDSPSVFYENTMSGNNWLKVRTVGRMGRVSTGAIASNRDGIGARIVVATDTGEQLRVVRSGSSYLSMNDLTVHFGIANAATVDRVEIEWPSGLVDVRAGIEVNQTIVICEGGWPVEFKDMSGTANARRASINLNWRLLCDGVIAGFRLYRAREIGEGTFDTEESLGFVNATTREWTDNTIEAEATYRYSVAAVGPGDEEIRSASVTIYAPSPIYSLELRQNYPNPFNPQTTIAFGLDEAGWVRLAVYDTRGALVEVLIDADRDAGLHQFVWRPGVASPVVASAIYFFRLETARGELTRKMVVLR